MKQTRLTVAYGGVKAALTQADVLADKSSKSSGLTLLWLT